MGNHLVIFSVFGSLMGICVLFSCFGRDIRCLCFIISYLVITLYLIFIDHSLATKYYQNTPIDFNYVLLAGLILLWLFGNFLSTGYNIINFQTSKEIDSIERH